MAIDEKQIGEEMHTIVSNRETEKIALLVRSMSYQDLARLLDNEDPSCRGVEILTRDLSSLFAKVGNDLLPNASHVADKFHLIRSLIESCQGVRVRLRQEVLRDKRLKYQACKKEEKERRKRTLEEGKEYVKQSFKYEGGVLGNEETLLEGLARSRYLLFKYPNDWTPSQKKRAIALFKKYPEIEKAYKSTYLFRDWIKKENVGKQMRLIKQELAEWLNQVEDDDIDEMLNIKSPDFVNGTPKSKIA